MWKGYLISRGWCSRGACIGRPQIAYVRWKSLDLVCEIVIGGCDNKCTDEENASFTLVEENVGFGLFDVL